jgi:hypothetical protein
MSMRTLHRPVREVHALFRARTPGQMLSTATPSSSPWLPEGYGQNYQAAAYDLVRD